MNRLALIEMLKILFEIDLLLKNTKFEYVS